MEGVQLTALALLVLFGSNWVSQKRETHPVRGDLIPRQLSRSVSRPSEETARKRFFQPAYHALLGWRVSVFRWSHARASILLPCLPLPGPSSRVEPPPLSMNS